MVVWGKIWAQFLAMIAYRDLLKHIRYNLSVYNASSCQIELYNSMVDKEGTETEVEAMKAYRAAREESEDADEADTDEVSSALTDKVDAMLQNLEKEINDVDAKIGDHWRVLDSHIFMNLGTVML